MRKAFLVLLVVLLVSAGYYLSHYRGTPPDVPSKGGPSTGNGPGVGALLRLDKTVYSPKDMMVITIINDGKGNITTGYSFKLYKLENGTWREVPVNRVFIEVAVVIGPGKSWKQRVNLADLNLKPGRYRIVKTVVVTDPVTRMSLGIEAGTGFEVKS